MSYPFPTDTCVVACSGPSLNKVNVASLGLPVCAISTTIRSIPNPDFWFIADHLNEMHGQEGQDAWNNESIVKIVPNKVGKTPGRKVITHAYHEGREPNQHYQTLLFDPNKPLLRGPHKTLTFAIQWLHVCGVKNIIFAGNDLEALSFDTKYSYELKNFDTKKQHNFKKTLDQIKGALVSWYPVALSKGYNWYSWECGSVFESFVPKFNEEILQNVQRFPTAPRQVYSSIEIKEEQKRQEHIKEIKELQKLSEEDRNRREYFRMMRQKENKEEDRKKINMQTYFDLVQKRRK
jgi:hypothetical protein